MSDYYSPWVRCADVKNRVEHERHWYTIMADKIVVAQGTCSGYKSNRGRTEDTP